MHIEDLRHFAADKGIKLSPSKTIIVEALRNIDDSFRYSPEEVKANFDHLVLETEKEAHRVYRNYEREYAGEVLAALISHLVERGEIGGVGDVGSILGAHSDLLDKFYMSLAQGRKARAGRAFEQFHNNFFRRLDYPFTEQPVINGKPDFLLPSEDYYRENAPDCIIFTAKRTIRERWGQIVTEGTRGLGFYLSTIDASISRNELTRMRQNRITIVCPQEIQQQNYKDVRNVLSYQDFFRLHLDPAMTRWKATGVVE